MLLSPAWAAGTRAGIELAPSSPGKNNQTPAGTDMAERERHRVFSARNLTKVYRMGETQVHALRGIDLDLFERECVVLLGPSGSGKSTLLNILGGLDAATQGEVHYRDHDLVQASAHELTRFRREHVGFVFQFYNLIPSLTAAENIALVTELVDQPMDVGQALDLVGLKERAEHFPSQLSGGEQQRIAMARAVAKRPDILLCDEPTGALDFQTGKLVLETILKINEELGTLVVVITHNAAIAGLADRVIHLANGQISQIDVNPQRRKVDEILW
jgi:putative ABC transport system ATP-binding protein